jgi:hypothetical protein
VSWLLLGIVVAVAGNAHFAGKFEFSGIARFDGPIGLGLDRPRWNDRNIA